MTFFWNISCLFVCMLVMCLCCNKVEAEQDVKFGERTQMPEKSLGAWIDILRHEIHKGNRHEDELQEESRRGPLLPCIYNGLKDLHENIVMRPRSFPDSTFDIYQSTSPLHHTSEHSMFYTPRLGRSSLEKQK